MTTVPLRVVTGISAPSDRTGSGISFMSPATISSTSRYDRYTLTAAGLRRDSVPCHVWTTRRRAWLKEEFGSPIPYRPRPVRYPNRVLPPNRNDWRRVLGSIPQPLSEVRTLIDPSAADAPMEIEIRVAPA